MQNSLPLQTLAVLWLVAWILLSFLTGTAMMVYMVVYTRLWPVPLAYLIYMAATWDLMNRHGLQCSAVQCSGLQGRVVEPGCGPAVGALGAGLAPLGTLCSLLPHTDSQLCTVLHCTVLHFIALHCTAQHCT